MKTFQCCCFSDGLKKFYKMHIKNGFEFEHFWNSKYEIKAIFLVQSLMIFNKIVEQKSCW